MQISISLTFTDTSKCQKVLAILVTSDLRRLEMTQKKQQRFIQLTQLYLIKYNYSNSSTSPEWFLVS